MVSLTTINNRYLSLKNKENLLQHFIFIVILLGLFLLQFLNYYLFHSVAEIFSCIISGGILIISLNTYKLTKNNFFMFLGIGHAFIVILDVFHTITYGDIIILQNSVYDIDTKFWIAGRSIELLTLFFSFIFLFNKNIKPNYYLITIIYLIVVGFIIIDIINLNILIPPLRIKGYGLTKFKILAEYVLSFGFLICIFIFYKARNQMDKSLFLLLEVSIFCKVISELFFTMYFSVTDLFNLMGHIFKVISYYFTYMGIIVNGLQRPLEMINYNLNKADKIINEKETQRKSMENLVTQNDRCYELLIDYSGDGIVIISGKKLVYANSTAVNILGANNILEILERNICEFINDNNINKIEESKINTTFNELRILNLNKEIIDIEYSLNNINYKGKPAHLVIFKDIRFKKEINSLKNNLIENKEELFKSNEYNKILTEFFSNISHELKTPINVILGAVQLLALKENEKLPVKFEEKLYHLLNVMKLNSFRLIRLINNLIDVSKFDSGFLKLNLHNHNIVSIVEDITLSVGDFIKSKGVNIIFDTDVEEKIIAVDDDKIERIMLNLLSNAVKFTNNGGEILINIEDLDEMVRILVKDTGVGIPADKLETIFDRFAQVEKTLIRNREGSGIGLSLVKNLTEMHGGNICVNSKVGEGSEFIINLPVRIAEEKENQYMQNSDNKTEKVLIEFSDIN